VARELVEGHHPNDGECFGLFIERFFRRNAAANSNKRRRVGGISIPTEGLGGATTVLFSPKNVNQDVCSVAVSMTMCRLCTPGVSLVHTLSNL
jgi:hypothetical protein